MSLRSVVYSYGCSVFVQGLDVLFGEVLCIDYDGLIAGQFFHLGGVDAEKYAVVLFTLGKVFFFSVASNCENGER